MRAVRNRSQNLQGTGTRYSTNKNRMKILNPSSHKSTLIDSSKTPRVFTCIIAHIIETSVLSISGPKLVKYDVLNPQRPIVKGRTLKIDTRSYNRQPSMERRRGYWCLRPLNDRVFDIGPCFFFKGTSTEYCAHGCEKTVSRGLQNQEFGSH